MIRRRLMNEMIFSSVFPFWDKLDDDDKTAIKDGHITKTLSWRKTLTWDFTCISRPLSASQR